MEREGKNSGARPAAAAGPPAGERLTVTAGAADAGDRLDRVLARGLPGLSRSRLKALILEGRVAAGGATIEEPATRVKPGQTFAIIVPEPSPASPEAQPLPLAIVYEDDDLIVLDKPAGLVVHPAPGHPDLTLVNALLAHCGETLSGVGGVRRPGIVHRLDKDTSGLMVTAKNDRAHAALAAQFKARRVARAYTALVWGVPRTARGVVEAPIGRSPRNRKKMAVVRRGGRPALTRWRVVRAYGPAARLECRLGSGRTHQIRVHLAHMGHPVMGDRVYGGGAGRAALRGLGAEARERIGACLRILGRQALHAHLIGFDHPRTGKRLTFESPLPEDMAGLVDCLESL